MLNSTPVLADTNCMMVYMYMSVVLLVFKPALGTTGFGFVDSSGALGLIYFSYNEAKEFLKKAVGMED